MQTIGSDILELMWLLKKKRVHSNRLKPYFNPNLRLTNIPAELEGNDIVHLEMEQTDTV